MFEKESFTTTRRDQSTQDWTYLAKVNISGI